MGRTRSLLQNPLRIEPVTADMTRTVRFDELDPMGIMWHGRYASWFEDGREKLGGLHGIAYADFFRSGVMAPVKKFSVDYARPLRHGTAYTIRTSLLWSDAPRIDYRYEILDAAGQVMTTAATTQLFTDTEGRLLLEFPPFYAAFRERWKAGFPAAAGGQP